jgi:hypothetical protein
MVCCYVGRGNMSKRKYNTRGNPRAKRVTVFAAVCLTFHPGDAYHFYYYYPGQL